MGWGALIGLLASLAGTGMQMAGNQKASNEMERKVKAELLRQKGYQQQADSAYQQNAKENAAPVAKKEIATGGGERQAAYENAQAIPLTQGQAPVVGSPTSMNEKLKMALSNQTRSNLAGYDQWALARMLDNERAGQSIGMLNNFARGSNNVLPMEVQNAQHAGDGLSQVGQLVGLAGMLAGSSGWGSAVGAAGSAAGQAQTQSGYKYNQGGLYGWK